MQLDGTAPIDSDVSLQDLLKHLCIRDQALAVADELFEQALRVGFLRG